MKIVDEALKWVGYLEKKSNISLNDFTANAGSNNYTRFAVDYCSYFGESLNVYQAQPWCAMFVSVVFANVYGAETAEKLLGGHYAYCPYGVNNFKRAGIWHTSNPQVGDVIIFKNTSGVACHTGIVYAVDRNRVYTVEGNTSSASGVVANGGCVAKKSYSLSYGRIMGYGRPNYESEDIDMEELRALTAEVAELKSEIAELKNPMIYDYIDDNMPEWARAGVQWCVDNGIISGTGTGLGLSDSDLRWCTMLMRLGKQ